MKRELSLHDWIITCDRCGTVVDLLDCDAALPSIQLFI